MKKILSLFLFLVLCISTAYCAADHYLERAVSDKGEANAWRKMPVSVYIQNNVYAPQVLQAFQTWQNSLGGVVRFTLSQNPNTANIKVTFANNLPQNNVGLTSNSSSGGAIQSSHIQLVNPPNPNLNNNFMYSVALHEIGHALGINGHSSSKGDVMYPSVTSRTEKQKLSSRDILTVKWLYKVDKNTLNKHSGYLKNSKIAEAEAYARKFPHSTVGWNNLAAAYSENNMYAKAELAYKKALELNPKAFKVYRNLAITYAKQNKKTAAFNSAKKAYLLNPTFEYLQFVSSYVFDAESKKQMRQLYTSYSKNNPKSKNSSELNKIRRNAIF